MREQKGAKTQAMETRDENVDKGEPCGGEKKREAKKYDTLVDDNPCICRGID